VSVSDTVALTQVSLGERPRYGSPYPDGIAYGRAAVVGDASGGTVTLQFTAEGQFLYRLENLIGTKDDQLSASPELLLQSAWLSDRSPDLALGEMNLLYVMEGKGFGNGGAGFVPALDAQAMFRRTPLGRFIPTGAALLIQTIDSLNTDLAEYQLWAVLSYWRKEATYLPGFWSVFLQSPEVPPIVPR